MRRFLCVIVGHRWGFSEWIDEPLTPSARCILACRRCSARGVRRMPGGAE